MNPVIAQSLPIIGLVGIGFVLRQVGVIRAGDGNVMARLIINATLPAVIFLSVAQAEVSPSRLAVLLLCGMAIPLLQRMVAGFFVDRLHLERRVAGVMLISTMVAQVGFFLFPFFLSVYGKEGLSRLAAFDLGNSLIANSYGFYLAISYGNKPPIGLRDGLRRVFSIPILWAGLLGLVFNLSRIQLPFVVAQMLETLEVANTPLAMITLGTFLQFRYTNWKPMALTVMLRMGMGFLIGLAIVRLVPLDAIERAAVGVGAAMPVGLVVLVYSVTEGLDAEFAAGVISLSILVGLFVTPILLSVY
jgi:malate permease and related proteins